MLLMGQNHKRGGDDYTPRKIWVFVLQIVLLKSVTHIYTNVDKLHSGKTFQDILRNFSNHSCSIIYSMIVTTTWHMYSTLLEIELLGGWYHNIEAVYLAIFRQSCDFVGTYWAYGGTVEKDYTAAVLWDTSVDVSLLFFPPAVKTCHPWNPL